MSGRVCAKHECWCPNGECRWCEPVPIATPPDYQYTIHGNSIVLKDGTLLVPRVGLTLHGSPVLVDANMRGSDPPVLISFRELWSIAEGLCDTPAGRIEAVMGYLREYPEEMRREYDRLTEPKP